MMVDAWYYGIVILNTLALCKLLRDRCCAAWYHGTVVSQHARAPLHDCCCAAWYYGIVVLNTLALCNSFVIVVVPLVITALSFSARSRTPS